jgi:uncharacterized GH25 family protein
MRLPFCLLPAWLALFAGSTAAHFNMLLPDSASAKKGEVVTFTYQWGHPFEHQLFDAPAPARLTVIAPDGKKIDLGGRLHKTTRKAGDKEVTAYEVRFTPAERGDHVVVLQTPPIWMEEEGEFWQDTVKVVLHVQVQKGWDRSVRDDFEWLPLTRPYGSQPGMVFQARIHDSSRSPAGPLVEIERYNAAPPKKLPPDEHITRTAKTDPNGVVTATLTEAGWWCLTTARMQGTLAHEGKASPLRQRSTLWVFVDENTAPK